LLIRAALVTLTLTLSALATVARADSSADEAEARFRHGAALYKAGKFEEALLEFFASNRLAPNRNVVFNIARSYEALGQYDEAYQYYDAYRAAETAAGERGAAEAKLRQLAPLVPLLAVDSDPPGATVYIDRKDLGGHGETPLTIALPPGGHKVIVEKQGFEAAAGTVELVRGRRANARLRLEAIVGVVEIASRPSAEVRIDRAEDDVATADFVGTPATARLAPGRHALELRAPGYLPMRRLLLVEPHGRQVLDVTLEPRPAPSGTLAIGGARGAAVTIDGRAYGETPLVSPLAVGTHRLRVVADGYEGWERDVVVVKDGHEFIEVDLREREPEVVAATRQTQRLGDAPASVSLVSPDELAAFGYETLADALRSVRGLYASDDRNYRAVGIRGFSRPGDYTNRVLVLRDGHVYNDDIVGSGFVGRELAPDLSDVARVEVVRGPGSAFYGQGAFFGVVNVVSLPAGAGPPLSAGGALLSDGSSRAHVRAAAPLGSDGGITASAQAYASTGQNLFYEDFRATPSGGFARDSDGEDAERGALRLRLGRFFVDASYNRRKKDVPTASFDTVFDAPHVDGFAGDAENTIDERGTFEARWDGGTVYARAFGDYSGYRGEYPYDDSSGKFVLHDGGRGLGGGAEARVTLTAPSWNQLSLGVEGEVHDIRLNVDNNGDGKDDFVDEHTPQSAAAYAVDQLSFGPAATLTLGGRVDLLGISDQVVFSPRVAAVLRPYAGGRTKIVLGQSYRAPSDYEQYYYDNDVTQMRAKKLDAEIIDTAEAEHVHELGRGTYILASVFGSRIQKLIGLVTDPATNLLVYRNSDETVQSLGAELEARKTWDSGAWIGAAVSVTDLSGGDLLTRANSPPVVGYVKGLVPLGKDATLAGELIYNAPRQDREGGTTEHMVLGDIAASGWLLGHRLRWQVAVTNVLDWKYSVPVGDEFMQRTIPQDGRRFQAGLGYEY
jgi:outer membrane receptor protein involved in Fe transport